MPKQKWKYPTDTPTYNSWRAMRGRCLYNNANNKNHKQKGIGICERWSSYNHFVEDMGLRPDGTTLDRIDSTKDYSPDNCRWADWRTQENNKAELIRFMNNGEAKTVGQWAYDLGLSDKQLSRAYKRKSAYGATTFEELFVAESLRAHRVAKRDNKCTECGQTKSCKWRKDGTQCNTCYHREFRKTKTI